MIVLSNTTAQTVQPGQAVLFDRVAFRGCCCDRRAFGHREGTGSVRLRENGQYKIEFHGNIGGAAATQPNLAIAIDGSALPETTMTATITAATDVFNVSAGTGVHRRCGESDVITVINTGTTPVELAANPALIVTRID